MPAEEMFEQVNWLAWHDHNSVDWAVKFQQLKTSFLSLPSVLSLQYKSLSILLLGPVEPENFLVL